MSTTVKLPYERFVRQVSSGRSQSKYGYIGMMKNNEEALKNAEWVLSRCDPDDVTLTTNQLTKTDGVFNLDEAKWTTEPTYTAYIDDRYDAFKQAGDAVARNATMCAYAGCVVYRFKIPQSPNPNMINSVSICVQRDRYLRSGVKIVTGLTNSETIPDDWDVIRGTNASANFKTQSVAPSDGVVGVSSFGFLGQPDVAMLTESTSAEDTITFTGPWNNNTSNFKYFLVFMSIEDYCGRWDKYKGNEIRQYYIEGSAMIVASKCEFEFSEAPDMSTPSTESLVINFEGEGSYSKWNIVATGGTAATGEFRKHAFVATDVFIPGSVWEGNNGALTRDFATGYNDGLSLKFSATGIKGVMGAYSGFFEGKMQRCNVGLDTDGKVSNIEGAAFYIGRRCELVDGTYSVDMATNNNVGSDTNPLFIARKKLLIPFILAGGKAKKPKRVTFSWKKHNCYSSSGEVVAGEVQFNAWIFPGKSISDYSLNTLQNSDLWVANRKEVGGFKLLSKFTELFNEYNFNSANGWNDTTMQSKTVDVPFDIELNVPNTLLLTVYIPNQFSVDDTTGRLNYQSFAASRTLSTYADTRGGDLGFAYELGGVLNKGWSPEVTFTT